VGTYTLSIPDWLPVRLNRLIGCHWGTRSKLKKADRQLVGVYAKMAGIPIATTRRRISLTFTLGGRGRAPDPDNLLKALLDSLVQAGLLRDDSGRWCELGEVEVVRGTVRQTTIRLEDLGDVSGGGGESRIT
jgi:Holliday junction resolvase RusA-like endonuclease